jgi:hypothetical protein
MIKCSRFVCARLALLPLILLTAIDSRADDPVVTPGTPTVPWTTQEKVLPPEIEKKKDEQPVATCKKKDKEGDQYDEVIYADGTKVKYWPKLWVIETPGPNGTVKTTYDATKKTITVKEKGKPPVEKKPETDPAAKKWKEDLEKAEADAKKKSDLTPRLAPAVRQASLLTPWFDNWITNIGYSASVPPPLFRTAATANASAPLQLAATAEKTKPAEKPPVKQAYVVINLKVVTYGGPPPGATIHFFDPEDPKRPTPDDFAKTDKPQNTWKPDDVPGPQTTPGPKPGGFVPVTPKDKGGGGGYVYIGGNWAYVRVPVSFFESCASDDDDSDDGPNDGPTKGGDKPKQQSSAPKADPKKQSLAPSQPGEPRRDTTEAAEYPEYKVVGQQRGIYDLES